MQENCKNSHVHWSTG